MARSLLLHSALAAAALALRLPSSGDVDPALLAAVEARHHNVPPIDQFRELWTKRYSSEAHLWEPMPSSIQLVLGLFTVAPDFEYREVVRQTWFNQTGVCLLQSEPQEGCSVYVAFIVGKKGLGDHPHSDMANMSLEEVKATHGETGMLVLDTVENMNEGKSRVWFNTARRLFPWATHLGKIDMDTYPLLHKLVHRMEASRDCSLHHNPYEVIGRAWSLGRNPFTYACGGDACPQFTSAADSVFPNTRPGVPWQYIAGELYVLSMPLVQQISWGVHQKGTEDMQTTRHVGEAAKRGGFCVVLRRLDSWYHNNPWNDANYTNEL